MPRTTTKKATAPKITKPATTPDVIVETQIPESVQEIKKPTIIKLDDTVLITVKSNVYGQLIYINSKTGDKTVWSNYGDTQQLSMGDLRAMKGSQRVFYENIWITIEGVYDDGYEDVTTEDIYRTLQVQQYYKEILCPNNLGEIMNWSPSEIESKVPLMTNGAKVSLIVLANELIECGVLDSLGKIKALEKALGCELEIK